MDRTYKTTYDIYSVETQILKASKSDLIKNLTYIQIAEHIMKFGFKPVSHYKKQNGLIKNSSLGQLVFEKFEPLNSEICIHLIDIR